MKYQISCVGKSLNTPEDFVIKKFIKRFGNNLVIKEVNVNFNDIKKKIQEEGKKLIELSPKNSVLVLLDKDGLSIDSKNFVKLIKNCQSDNFKVMNFLIGGAFGHGPEIKKKSNHVVSLGKMTYSHLISRILIVEQLYRAESILNNHPYHK